MFSHLIILCASTLLVAIPLVCTQLQDRDRDAMYDPINKNNAKGQVTVSTSKLITEKQSTATPSRQRRKGKKVRHRKRKHNRQMMLSARLHLEKQVLVRNSTLTLLGQGMDKFLPNAVDLLDINPEELPGESPFQNWHNLKPNQTKEADMVLKKTKETEPILVLKPTKEISPVRQQTFPSLIDDLVIDHQHNYEELSADSTLLQVNFGIALKRLMDIFANYSSINDLHRSPCEQWMSCREQMRAALMGPLPACPCHYPSGIVYDDTIWDTAQHRSYRWRDASNERLDVYEPGAEYCVRSLPRQGSHTFSVQHCCYDRSRRLVTRGSGAGSPHLVSPDVSPQLHDRLDRLPWRLCKGDFTVLNRIRPPDNANLCPANPGDQELTSQILQAKYY